MAAPPPEELSILENFISIRNRLTALKKDRGEYIKSSDVNALYQAVVKQVTRLNDVRNDESAYNNRVDATLADVFSLLSLFYLTIGKTRDAPATYSQLASMRQILEHMNESAVYSESDLAPFRRRLKDVRQIISQQSRNNAITKLLDRQANECDSLLRSMEANLSVLSAELTPIHERLVKLRRALVTLAAKEGSHKAELKPIMEELRKIDSQRVDGKFLGPGGVVPSSQAICSSTLEECFEIVQEIKAQDESKNVASSLLPIYDRLCQIRQELEGLVLTHRWSLRETDLWNYSLSLQEIDKMRVDGKFVDQEGNRPSGQYVLLYLLRRCYGLIYRLLSSSEPVSEELMPVANKLSTVKKCLNEVLKYGGPFSPRDLYPYQLALFQIDSMRKDGKFVGEDGSIPEGQGIVMAHLNECHELIEMLKEAMDEGDFEDEDEEYDGSGVEDQDVEYDQDQPPDSEDDEDTPQAGERTGSFPTTSMRTPSASGDSLQITASSGGAQSPDGVKTPESGQRTPANEPVSQEA
ncbi:hypothetical protein BD626DRAFT_503769 [Schizophyllum amplum]|uniref:Uncharacterized protein n=1 Tax=Schizophyllum amplum TaxID=97359 RepID=A0A550C7H1_9AGAR|nr:hypothetical protein BD626DRAFT_503769 [Auriculariopsis ampla]